MGAMARYVLLFDYADAELRAEVRPRHLDYLRELHARGELVEAGPFEDGAGALIVYEAADEAAAQALVDADPYSVEGVMTGARLRAWNVVLPPA